MDKIIANGISYFLGYWKIRNVKNIRKEEGLYVVKVETPEGEKELYITKEDKEIAVITLLLNLFASVGLLLVFHLYIYPTPFLITPLVLIYTLLFLPLTSPIVKIRVENPIYYILILLPIIGFIFKMPIALFVFFFKVAILNWILNCLIFAYFLFFEKKKVYKLVKVEDEKSIEYTFGIFVIYKKETKNQ